MTKRIIFLFIPLLGLLLSCAKKNSDSIRIGILNGPTYVSFLYMIENPPVVDGKRIEFVVKSDPQQIQALMMSGDLDLAVLPTVMAANLYNKGLEYRMVACPVWGTLYLLSNNTKVNQISDLINEKVYVFGQGATPDVLLSRFLTLNNIQNVAMDYSYNNNVDLATAMLSRNEMNALVSEPLVSMLLHRDSSIHIVSKLDCEDFFYNSDKDIFVQTAFLVHSDFSSNYPATLRTLCEAYSASCNSVNSDTLKTASLMLKYGIVNDESIALKSIPLCNIRYVASFAIDREVDKYLRIFFEVNPESVGGKLPDRNFIHQLQ